MSNALVLMASSGPWLAHKSSTKPDWGKGLERQGGVSALVFVATVQISHNAPWPVPVDQRQELVLPLPSLLHKWLGQHS